MGMSQRKKKGKVLNYNRPVNKKNATKNQKRVSENNAALRSLDKGQVHLRILVGVRGFEPPAPASRRQSPSNQQSKKPLKPRLQLHAIGPKGTQRDCNGLKFSTFSAHQRRGGIHPLSRFKTIDIFRSHSQGVFWPPSAARGPMALFCYCPHRSALTQALTGLHFHSTCVPLRFQRPVMQSSHGRINQLCISLLKLFQTKN